MQVSHKSNVSSGNGKKKNLSKFPSALYLGVPDLRTTSALLWSYERQMSFFPIIREQSTKNNQVFYDIPPKIISPIGTILENVTFMRCGTFLRKVILLPTSSRHTYNLHFSFQRWHKHIPEL